MTTLQNFQEKINSFMHSINAIFETYTSATSEEEKQHSKAKILDELILFQNSLENKERKFEIEAKIKSLQLEIVGLQRSYDKEGNAETKKSIRIELDRTQKEFHDLVVLSHN